MKNWLAHHAWAIAAASLLLTVLVSAIVAVWAVRLPRDYFLNQNPSSHSLIRSVLQNAGGVLLVAIGIVLSLPLVPGPGLLLILLGLSLTKFPGKRKLELQILRRASVLHPLNRLRARFGRPPLHVPHVGRRGRVTAVK